VQEVESTCPDLLRAVGINETWYGLCSSAGNTPIPISSPAPSSSTPSSTPSSSIPPPAPQALPLIGAEENTSSQDGATDAGNIMYTFVSFAVTSVATIYIL